MFHVRPGKDLLLPVPRGRGRRERDVQWRLVNLNNASKNVRLDDFMPNNPFTTTPSSTVEAHDTTLMTATVTQEAEGLYRYTVFVDDQPAKDPEIMIET